MKKAIKGKERPFLQSSTPPNIHERTQPQPLCRGEMKIPYIPPSPTFVLWYPSTSSIQPDLCLCIHQWHLFLSPSDCSPVGLVMECTSPASYPLCRTLPASIQLGMISCFLASVEYIHKRKVTLKFEIP